MCNMHGVAIKNLFYEIMFKNCVTLVLCHKSSCVHFRSELLAVSDKDIYYENSICLFSEGILND
jgi:hypothetical protein